jgi:hypothetical protein
MIEVSISFGVSDGDGVETYIVNVESDGFTTQPYLTAIHRATLEFSRARPHAIIDRVTIRSVPPMPAILEVE